jgi:hypothetical protein
MLDKFLTGENVKVNGEIAGRRHILRTLQLYLWKDNPVVTELTTKLRTVFRQA